MSVGQESELSDEGLSVETESKDKAPHNVFLVPPQDQTGVVKDYSKQNSPKYVLDSDLDQTSLENKRDMQLIPKMVSDYVGTEGCEITTKATNFANSSTNDLLEIKAKRQSTFKKGFCDKPLSPDRINHTDKEMWTENETQVVNLSHTRGRQKFETPLMDINSTDSKTESLEYRKDCIVDYKSQMLCHGREERFESLDTGWIMAMSRAGDSLEQNDEGEVLDLSLPKKNERNKERQCEWIVDPDYEGSLHMEVDEIEDEPQHVEVEQEDDYENCWIPSISEAHSYVPQHWDGHLPFPSLATSPTTMYTNITPDPIDPLLIDDQGIPYTLTPDGQKVPQIDDKQHTEGLSEQTALSRRQVEDKPSSIADVQDIADSKQQTQPNRLCANHIPSILPAVSDMTSVPIQIVANNTGSNTPILLLPPSQLQSLSSPVSKGNPGVMTLSLPVPLSQSTQSSPMFLVLSSPQVSSTQSSSSPGTLSQISSTSTVALPLATCPLDLGSTLYLPPSLLNLSTISSATTTEISGPNNPSNLPGSPTSSTASSSSSTVTSTSPTKQFSSDAYSDPPVPTSFREALLRLAVSAEKKNEKQPQSPETHSVSTPSSCSKTTKPDSSLHEMKNHQTEINCEKPCQATETGSTSVDQKDSIGSMSTNDLSHLSSTSPLRPASPVLPIDHPKNQDSQSLGPRRILYCQYCPRIFYYLSDLERHSITHSQNKPHVCQLCGKAFKRSSHLERHKHIHTGQRNFVCQLCPRRFRESGELMRHQRVHTGEKPYQCLICHMRFAERNTLRRHTKRKHQGQQQVMDMNAKAESGEISLTGIKGEPEDNAEWYSSTVPEMESNSDTGGE
ncbi:fez family zinc finger protein erm-like isoform X1 [Xyrauchen texanus]|uniref:fez family zinc finger protein erm-like isoform X1 n=2 Tax=Xyrauchen texanus TaxID=154827 RepID=UPI0022429DAF|nr:fez family zinc finger protein erm-like isoform X1 [Xyrauchen texanus]